MLVGFGGLERCTGGACRQLPVCVRLWRDCDCVRYEQVEVLQTVVSADIGECRLLCVQALAVAVHAGCGACRLRCSRALQAAVHAGSGVCRLQCVAASVLA